MGIEEIYEGWQKEDDETWVCHFVCQVFLYYSNLAWVFVRLYEPEGRSHAPRGGTGQNRANRDDIYIGEESPTQYVNRTKTRDSSTSDGAWLGSWSASGVSFRIMERTSLCDIWGHLCKPVS
jgi:hypothetical protein